MNYEAAGKKIGQAAVAVSGAHLALIVLDVAVLSAGLPNVYVSDAAASCGARFLVRFTSHHILQSGLIAFAALALSVLYTSWIEVRRLSKVSMGDIGMVAYRALFSIQGVLSLTFFVSAITQLGILGNPPALPADFEKNHVCNVLSVQGH